MDGRTISSPLLGIHDYGMASRKNDLVSRLSATAPIIYWPELDEDLSVAGILAGGTFRGGLSLCQRWLDTRNGWP